MQTIIFSAPITAQQLTFKIQVMNNFNTTFKVLFFSLLCLLLVIPAFSHTENGSSKEIRSEEHKSLEVISITASTPLCSNRSSDFVTFTCPEVQLFCDNAPGSIDQVGFFWTAIQDVEAYLLSYIVNGGPEIDAGSTTDTFFILNGLLPGDIVELSVSPRLDNCPACPSSQITCPVGACPEVAFIDPFQQVCFDGTSIFLTPPSVIDNDGNELTGNLIWGTGGMLNINQNTGEFLPDIDQSQTYVLDLTWEDPFSSCVYSATVTLVVNLLPDEAEILPLENICLGDTVIIEALEITDPAVSYVWSWKDGIANSNEGPGPHQVQFLTLGSKLISLNVSSAADCQTTTQIDLLVFDTLLPIIIACGNITASSIEWTWVDQPGVTSYDVEVRDLLTGEVVFSGESFSTSLIVENLESDVDYEISITATSTNFCPSVSESLVCRPSCSLFINNIVPNVSDCILDDIPSFEIFASGGVEPFEYRITNLPEIDTVITDSIYDVPFPGSYAVTVVDADGCTDELVVQILPSENPTLVIEGPLVIINQESATYTFTLGGTTAPITSLQWFINDTLIAEGSDIDVNNVVISTSNLGTEFTVKVRVFFGENCFIETCSFINVITSTNEFDPLTVEVFPNPFSDFVTLQYSEVGLSYSLRDIQGKLLETNTLQHQLNFSTLPPGCYLFEIFDTNSGKRTIERIIKY